MSVTTKAKYSGRCDRCSIHIYRGDEITSEDGKRPWLHHDCYVKSKKADAVWSRVHSAMLGYGIGFNLWDGEVRVNRVIYTPSDYVEEADRLGLLNNDEELRLLRWHWGRLWNNDMLD